MTPQEKIDKIAYPPTHNYKLDGLEPIGTLKERMNLFPDSFFHGDKFLDIGCNKGFFMLYAKQYCNHVKGIDNDPKMTKLCSELDLDVNTTSFRDYNPDMQFDRIMLGNVMHYLYRECGDWTWIIKLASISTGLVLIESPIDMNCMAMYDVLDRNLRGGYNEKNFMSMMDRFFILKSKTPSPTNDRWVMVFERKSYPQKVLTDENALLLKQNNETTTWRNKDKIIKVMNNFDMKKRISVFISSHSPISNGIRFIGENGWVEDYCDSPIVTKQSQQHEIFKRLCQHNVYLAKLGYTEMDMGLTNFFTNGKMFDKGNVFHIKDLQDFQIGNDGVFFKMMKPNFTIDIDYDKLKQTLNTKDSYVIEKFYSQFLDKKTPKFSLADSRQFAKAKALVRRIRRKL
jgi:SAM-dependent methyltransferase